MQEGVNGQQMDSQASLSMVMDTFLGLNDSNRIEFPVATSPPPALPADLNDLGIRSLIAESSTPYGAGNVPEKKHNIELAASLLNGTVVLPGQVFSFNAEVGAMTTDAGFQIAYGIANDNGDLRTVPAEAGGICQVASTVFQPVFWAGYQIERRSTHSYWIPSYASRGMVGLDATVDSTTGLDFRWMNNGPSAVLIEAVADGDNFTVRLYGTQPDWTVEVAPPEITNIVEASQEEVMQEDSSLPAGQQLRIERAQDGFDVTIVRKVHQSDGEVRELVLSAEYGPSRNVTLVGTGEDVADSQASTP
jgi:vancomycin resistance protein YoaR